jgi:hypothetical protein
LDLDELKSLSKDGRSYSTKKIGDNTSYFGDFCHRNPSSLAIVTG